MGRAPSSAPSRSTIEFIFLAHFFLELGLGLLKLRGKYAGFDAPVGMEKFARHHGVSLLSLALAGWLIYRQRLAFSAAGVVAALVLCAFHSGAVAVMLADGGGGALKVLAMHAPFAVAFGWHAFENRVLMSSEHTD